MPSLQGMLDWAVYWCNRENVGYNQAYRTMQVYNDITWFDCSSFTFFAMWLGGGFDLSQFGYSTDLADYTSIPRRQNAWVVTSGVHSMENCLPTLGWTQYNVGDIEWQPGDILTIPRQHTEIVYSVSPRMSMGARTSQLPLADQVAIHSTSKTGYWQKIWRYGSEPPTPPTPPVPPIPPSTDKHTMPLWLYQRPWWKYGGF